MPTVKPAKVVSNSKKLADYIQAEISHPYLAHKFGHKSGLYLKVYNDDALVNLVFDTKVTHQIMAEIKIFQRELAVQPIVVLVEPGAFSEREGVYTMRVRRARVFNHGLTGEWSQLLQDAVNHVLSHDRSGKCIYRFDTFGKSIKGVYVTPNGSKLSDVLNRIDHLANKQDKLKKKMKSTSLVGV